MTPWPDWIQSLKDSGTFLLSASSYKLADGCMRRWALKEIAKKREPDDPAKAFGTEGHRQTERFLLNGEAFDLRSKEGRCAIEATPHLPRPGTAQVEVPFAFEIDGAWFWGRIDAVGGVYSDGIAERKTDHKFTRTLDFAFTPETLVQDPAAVLYTLAPPSFLVTHLRWIYNLKSKRLSQSVDAVLPFLDALEFAREHLVPAWHLLSGIRSLFTGQEPESTVPFLDAVPCNPRYCLAFNRPCPHMAQCTRENVGLLKESICQSPIA